MKNVYMILMIGMSWIFWGCEDQLNALPSQSKVEGNVIIDQKSAEVALNGVYYCFAGGGKDYSDNWTTMWAFPHEIVPAMLSGYVDRVNGGGIADNSRIDAYSSAVSSLWKNNYILINAANGVIKQMLPLPADMFEGDRKAEIIAEARWLRAYGHYNLLRYFAQFYDQESEYGVMLRKEFVSTSNLSQKRTNVKESYDFILADLEDAILHAPLENEVIYINKWVAKGMKARVLMMRGETGDYEEVIRLTSDILEHGPYELEKNVRDIFVSSALESKEVMLGVEAMPNQRNKRMYYASEDRAPEYKALDPLREIFENDPRESWMIYLSDEKKQIYGVNKYDGPQVEQAYAMRLTEMYLLKAEAIVRAGQSWEDARSILKEVIEHTGVTDFSSLESIRSKEELLFAIYEENVRNLMFEDGIEWNALLRFPLEKIQSVNPTIKDRNHIILPIPADEFDKNPLIGKQNPGYSKN